jgi:coenzyme F420-reducing hydrogenase beta subunit
MQSSSGGAFSALAVTVLRRGGYVCAAAFDETYKSVRHIIISSESELPALRTSKYLQSDMSGIMQGIREKLQAGAEVLFVGTPCQVAGLHLFLKKEFS